VISERGTPRDQVFGASEGKSVSESFWCRRSSLEEGIEILKGVGGDMMMRVLKMVLESAKVQMEALYIYKKLAVSN